MITVAAISTPSGEGGIGVIRISGDNAVAVGDRVFFAKNGKKLQDIPGYTALYGEVKEGDSVLDEAVALVFRAPKSYTGEDVVELSCHGGNYVVTRILRLVLANGAVAAPPGEFTKRAFLNGKTDLARAEAVMQLISARGEDALHAALHTLEGTLSKKTAEIRASLISLSAALAVWADYPEDDIPAVNDRELAVQFTRAEQELVTLLNRFDSGQAISSGVDTVICGKPNVGKSALMNLLTGRERSIVTSVAGTTRDIIEENVNFGNVLLRLSDTAGIHETGDEVERIGVDRAVERIKNASLIYAVFDGSEALTAEDSEMIDLCKRKKCIAVLNKSDICQVTREQELAAHFDRIVTISAKSGDGYERLKEETEKLLGTEKFDTAAPMLMNERQYKCCGDALQYLREAMRALSDGMTLDAVNISVDSAIECLLELTGEKVSDAVVNEIFAKFCVGK